MNSNGDANVNFISKLLPLLSVYKILNKFNYSFKVKLKLRRSRFFLHEIRFGNKSR